MDPLQIIHDFVKSELIKGAQEKCAPYSRQELYKWACNEYPFHTDNDLAIVTDLLIAAGYGDAASTIDTRGSILFRCLGISESKNKAVAEGKKRLCPTCVADYIHQDCEKICDRCIERLNTVQEMLEELCRHHSVSVVLSAIGRATSDFRHKRELTD